MNRDIAVLFAQSYFRSRRIRICDPMTASGVRAIRYLLECPNVENVTASDVNPASVEFAKRMFRLNQLGKGSVIESDANALLSTHEGRFDLVDLDPFGSPASFFENALRSTIDGGVLAATATDMAPLTGARPLACFRKYNIVPIRSEFGNEIAVRNLIACLAFAASRLELGIRPVFSHASDHYSRIYVQVSKGRKAANESVKNVGFLEYCPTCLRRDRRDRLSDLHFECEDCGGRKKIGGPIWLGVLWDSACVKKMASFVGGVRSLRISHLQKLMDSIEQECVAPSFYNRVDQIARSLVANPPRIGSLLRALRDEGHLATVTHFHSNGFRTDAPNRIIRSEFSKLVSKT
jgi:tRNA (guanine26-N2/guanine27-N2)-dimethyltransferase